ncbi:hypothetical protein [Streptomyces monashensis]|uniref:hypothetical protein n=1 Tax=Streptomyces monashensis TaxID=1678012 RepID=UPI0015A6AB0B|nr:hypothetical protein [Streptomyces monashensis]
MARAGATEPPDVVVAVVAVGFQPSLPARYFRTVWSAACAAVSCGVRALTAAPGPVSA